MADTSRVSPTLNGEGAALRKATPSKDVRLATPAEDSESGHRPQRYPEAPGFKGSPNGPGADAAAYYAPQVKGRRRQVLNGLRAIGGRGTAEQIGAHINLLWYLTRPRLSELKALGLVVETGDRAASALGGQTTVWREATPEELSLFVARKAAESEHGEADHG